MACSICDRIPESSKQPLPEAASALQALDPSQFQMIGTTVDLLACPECGLWYLYTVAINSTEYMYGDSRETLERLSREQSELVHAVLRGEADPAVIENAAAAAVLRSTPSRKHD